MAHTNSNKEAYR